MHSVLIPLRPSTKRAGSATGDRFRRLTVDLVVPGVQVTQGNFRGGDQDDRGIRGQPKLRLRHQQYDGLTEEPLNLRLSCRFLRSVPCRLRARLIEASLGVAAYVEAAWDVRTLGFVLFSLFSISKGWIECHCLTSN